MIDIHVLTYSGTRNEWLDLCLESLAKEPCTVHVVRGVDGDICAGRRIGYALGSNEFVGYVDSDDYVLPGVIDLVLSGLERNVSVVTRELAIRADGEMSKFVFDGHHLFAARRDHVLPIVNADHGIKTAIDLYVSRRSKPVQLDCTGYVWRVHENGAHSTDDFALEVESCR